MWNETDLNRRLTGILEQQNYSFFSLISSMSSSHKSIQFYVEANGSNAGNPSNPSESYLWFIVPHFFFQFPLALYP